MSKLDEVGSTVTHRDGRKGTVLSNTLRRGPSFLAVEWDSGIVETVNVADLRDPIDEEFEKVRLEVNSRFDKETELAAVAALLDKEAHALRELGRYGQRALGEGENIIWALWRICDRLREVECEIAFIVRSIAIEETWS